MIISILKDVMPNLHQLRTNHIKLSIDKEKHQQSNANSRQ